MACTCKSPFIAFLLRVYVIAPLLCLKKQDRKTLTEIEIYSSRLVNVLKWVSVVVERMGNWLRQSPYSVLLLEHKALDQHNP